ncbi:(2,3-dihydroxybenzoyl)adenylate synthase [Streptomyces sp. TRM72054]|uniref:(2,3-dihydroxybenzoyl)adenylate synthase n=1 Tax=Streptomyces sp. TRM72054 TaxID=2870562 RepID=UPI001C8BE266|nr:(2,3-dihydroxybenzoyl)adenylate synthase [Streptomyces sp. TRM72054]MBX9393670.1 (2,3-dihydroxybenzoyl)adenylate synthase [Streptomyces sp. TRM72054]
MLEGCVPWPEELAAFYRREGYWQGRPLGDLLDEACARYADKTALVCGERRMTYAQLSAESSALAGGLLNRGIEPLDRVVVQLPNVPEFVVVVFALLRIGAIPVMALPGHRKVELTHLCAHSRAVALVVADEVKGFDHRSLAREVLAEVPALKHVVVAGDAEEFTALADLCLPGSDLPAVDPSQPALFLLSGGTTGLPKLIPRTHDDYAYNMRATAEALRFGEGSVYLAVNPVGHNSALGCPGVLGALLVGGTAVLTSSVRPDEVFELLERERVTLTTLVPPVVRLWIDAARKSDARFPDLTLQVGSSKFDPGRAAEVRTGLGAALTQWFGVGEGLLTYTRLDDPEEIIVGTEGRPLAEHDEILVVDADGRPVPEGAEGELLVRGPYTIRGYFRAEEQNRRAFTPDGYFRTGDMVRRRPDGSIVVVGRIKDIINRAGEKVPAEEVEEHLLTHDAIRDAAVVGVADPVLGEKSVAFVILRDKEVKPAAVKSFLRERGLATYKIPDKVVPVEEFPRTAVGKVDKVALRASV